MRKRLMNQRILFPWESAGGLRRWLGLGRIRPFALGGVILVLVVWVGLRERERSGIRQTRARLVEARAAVDAFMAEHDGGCPPNLRAALSYGSFEGVPEDAWGAPLRLRCPSDRPGYAYELISDGPDGLPGGLDRVE